MVVQSFRTRVAACICTCAACERVQLCACATACAASASVNEVVDRKSEVRRQVVERS